MNSNDIEELKGQIIDIFEDYLTTKGIASPDKAFIANADYANINKKLDKLLRNWQLV